MRVLLELSELIVQMVGSLISLARLLHHFSLACRQREDTLGHASIEVYRVVVNLDIFLLLCLHLHKVELIVGLSHHFFPVSVMVVLTNLLEFIANKLHIDCLLLVDIAGGQFNSETGAAPLEVKSFAKRL